jgi:hypothetical protein
VVLLGTEAFEIWQRLYDIRVPTGPTAKDSGHYVEFNWKANLTVLYPSWSLCVEVEAGRAILDQEVR